MLYIVRDPRDVLVSYYHYRITRRGGTTSMADFIEQYLRGEHGQQWHENIEGWFRHGPLELRDRFHLTRFEALKADPNKHLADALEFLGIATTTNTLERALEKSSIDNMREVEARRRGIVLSSDNTFYRGGKTGQWSELIGMPSFARFMEASRTAMHLAGYEP